MSEGGQVEIGRVGECIRCRVKMVAGHLRPQAGVFHPYLWEEDEGRPVGNVLGMPVMMDKDRFQLIALRCPRCGQVEFFAPDEKGSSVGRGEG